MQLLSFGIQHQQVHPMIAYGMLILWVAVFSMLAGMQGLGVGLVVLPFLALSSLDFITQVRPLVLMLNGLVALLILLTSGINAQIEVRKTILLIFSRVMGAFAGAYFLRFVLDRLCFVFFLYVYSLIVFYLLPGYSSGSSSEFKNYIPIGGLAQSNHWLRIS